MNLEKWMKEYCSRIDAAFSKRVRFIGLQGSRARGEEHENSDIDVVCILDELQAADIRRYRDAMEGIDHRELICGFLSGWNELLHWEASELLQFYHDTIPFVGKIDELLERIDDESIERAVCMGAGNIYHGCVHNMVHHRSKQTLAELYKAAGFVLRAEYYRKNHSFIRSSNDLICLLPEGHRTILQTAMNIKNGAEIDFDAMSETLFCWAQTLLAKREPGFK